MYHQTFPINKNVLKTKVYTAYNTFQLSTRSDVIRNAHCSMISLLQGKKNVLAKKRYDDYYNGIFAVHQNRILKSPFNSRVHTQKKEHGPYFEVSI